MGDLGKRTEISNSKKEELLAAAAKEKTSIKDGEKLHPSRVRFNILISQLKNTLSTKVHTRLSSLKT